MNMDLERFLSPAIAWTSILATVFVLTYFIQTQITKWFPEKFEELNKIPWTKIRGSVFGLWLIGVLIFVLFFGRWLSSPSTEKVTEARPTIGYEQPTVSEISQSNRTVLDRKDDVNEQEAKADNDAAMEEAKKLFSTTE